MHIVIPELLNKQNLLSYELGLSLHFQVNPVFQSMSTRKQLLDARFGGTFTIPEQRGTRRNRANQYDNSKHGLLDPQTLVEALMGGTNTSDLGIDEPTIQIDADNFFTFESLVPMGTLLHLTVSITGSPITRVGDFLKLGGSPARLYKIVQKVSPTVWLITPGVMPWGSPGDPKKAESLRFEMLNEVNQYRDYYYRGPWSIQFQEASF